jgi:subtilase family serine protease
LAQSRIKPLTMSLLVIMILVVCCPLTLVAGQTEWEAQPMYLIKTAATPQAISGMSPADVRAAYNLPSQGGAGKTIAIIDAYDDPNVARDLSTFSNQFGLPSANLEVHKMSSSIWPDANWAVEISLDVQWAHAVAPNAKILLVEARSNYLSDLLAAVNYARNRQDVIAVSMSWGASEFSTEAAYDSYFTSAYGASFFASSGDTGGAVIWPSSSVNVISVGGTKLALSNGAVVSETAWSGSGGGVSAYENKPTYQSALSYAKRATPDVSYDADPNTGFAVYDSYRYSGWLVVGGTSAGAPQWAAIQALGRTASNNNFYAIYNSPSYATDFRDIISGTSGSYTAKSGYDLTTGIGSPLTTNFASSPGPAPSPDFTIAASPNPVIINTAATNTGTTTVTVAALNQFKDTVTLTATSPTNWGVTFNPASVTASGTSTLTITIPAGTAATTYQVTVTGTNGSISHSTTVNVQVQAVQPDFALTVSPTRTSIVLGSTKQATVAVTPLNGYAGTIALSTSQPVGFTITFSPSSLQNGYSTMTMAVSFYTMPKTYVITITGRDNAGLTHTATISIKITTW